MPANVKLTFDAACDYKSLMVIERCFRSFRRTQIKMTPMYHWLLRRIEAHVKICVLALMIERIAELSCDKPWPTIRRALDKLQVTKFFDLNQRRHTGYFRRGCGLRALCL